jgi:hypothetical protein
MSALSALDIVFAAASVIVFVTLRTDSPTYKKDLDSFYKLVLAHPEAANLLKTYYRTRVTSQDRTLLHNFLIHNKNYHDAGQLAHDFYCSIMGR